MDPHWVHRQHMDRDFSTTTKISWNVFLFNPYGSVLACRNGFATSLILMCCHAIHSYVYVVDSLNDGFHLMGLQQHNVYQLELVDEIRMLISF